MQRLVLAVLLVALAAVAVAAVAGAVRAAWGTVDGAVHERRQGAHAMQRIAFFLLIALIFYVSVLGSA